MLENFHLGIVAEAARLYLRKGDAWGSPLTAVFEKAGLKQAPDFAIFWDYCSLYQVDPTDGKRTAEEEASFRRGLKASNIWYGHERSVLDADQLAGGLLRSAPRSRRSPPPTSTRAGALSRRPSRRSLRWAAGGSTSRSVRPRSPATAVGGCPRQSSRASAPRGVSRRCCRTRCTRCCRRGSSLRMATTRASSAGCIAPSSPPSSRRRRGSISAASAGATRR